VPRGPITNTPVPLSATHAHPNTPNSSQFPDCATHLRHKIATTCSLPTPLDRGKPHLSKDAGKPRPSEPAARKVPLTHIHTQVRGKWGRRGESWEKGEEGREGERQGAR
jgi:hypothetical protein